VPATHGCRKYLHNFRKRRESTIPGHAGAFPGLVLVRRLRSWHVPQAFQASHERRTRTYRWNVDHLLLTRPPPTVDSRLARHIESRLMIRDCDAAPDRRPHVVRGPTKRRDTGSNYDTLRVVSRSIDLACVQGTAVLNIMTGHGNAHPRM
jgi:hypothetical protein